MCLEYEDYSGYNLPLPFPCPPSTRTEQVGHPLCQSAYSILPQSQKSRRARRSFPAISSPREIYEFPGFWVPDTRGSGHSPGRPRPLGPFFVTLPFALDPAGRTKGTLTLVLGKLTEKKLGIM